MSRKRSIFSLIAISMTALVGGIVVRFRSRQKSARLVSPNDGQPGLERDATLATNLNVPVSEPISPAQIVIETLSRPASPPNRGLYWSGGLFFAALSAALSQSGILSPLLALCWLMSITLVGSALGASWRALFLAVFGNLKKTVVVHGLETLTLLAFTAAAAWMQLQTPAPSVPLPETARLMRDESTQDTLLPLALGGDGVTPVYDDGSSGIGFYMLEKLFTSHDLADLQRLSGLFAVLIIPVVYLLGRTINSSLIGLFAAGFAAVSGWTLALGKSGETYPALAFFAALYLAALIEAPRHHKRAAYIASGVIFGVGWLFSPMFVYMALLLPIVIALSWLDSYMAVPRKSGWLRFVFVCLVAGGKRLIPRLRNMMAAGLIAIIVILPFALAPRSPPPIKSTVSYDTGLSPATRFTEALSSSLLMFVVVSDPVPLHGIVNRPVFPPLVAAGFIIGLIAWLFRANSRKYAEHWFIIIALFIALLPSSLFIEPPARYPDLQRAALALPVAFVFTGFTWAAVVRLLTGKIRKIGFVITAALFLATLLLIGSDTYQNYTTIALPAYEQALPTYTQLFTHAHSQ